MSDMTPSCTWYDRFACVVWCIQITSVHESVPHCNTLQYTATHCNTLQHAATRCNTLRYTVTHYNPLRRIDTQCNTLQRATTYSQVLSVRDMWAAFRTYGAKKYLMSPGVCSIRTCIHWYLYKYKHLHTHSHTLTYIHEYVYINVCT